MAHLFRVKNINNHRMPFYPFLSLSIYDIEGVLEVTNYIGYPKITTDQYFSLN